MTNFRTGESGKVIVSLLAIINLILIAVIIWLLARPSVSDLRPKSGEADYLLSVNSESDPTIYSPNGVAWQVCQQGQCNNVPRDFGCDVEGLSGFLLADLTTGTPVRQPKAASMIDLFMSNAHAAVSDGKCPIIGIKRFFGVPILQYPAPSEDPDCPPN